MSISPKSSAWMAAVALCLGAGAARAQTYDVLLVDDDDNNIDMRGHFETMLAAAGVSYVVFDTMVNNDGPTATEMLDARAVVWFCGDNVANAGPSDADEVELIAALDAGAKLFLTCQDYIWADSGGNSINAFMQSHLGVDPVTFDNDTSANQISAIPGDYLSGAHGTPPYDSSVMTAFVFYPGDIQADGTAVDTWACNGGVTDVGVIRRETGAYRTMFWATPFEPLFIDMPAPRGSSSSRSTG